MSQDYIIIETSLSNLELLNPATNSVHNKKTKYVKRLGKKCKS